MDISADTAQASRKVRACDQCNFRKIKCRKADDGVPGCLSCRNSGLNCSSETAPKKRRGAKATRVEELLRRQSQTEQNDAKDLSVDLAVAPNPVFDPQILPQFASSSRIPQTFVPPTAPGPPSESLLYRMDDAIHQADDCHDPFTEITASPPHLAVTEKESSLDISLNHDESLQQWLTLFDPVMDTNISHTDSRALPFVDWARDSALDYYEGSYSISNPVPFPSLQQVATSPDMSQCSVEKGLDVYFQNFYPMFPILNEARIRAQIPAYLDCCRRMSAAQSPGAGSLVLSSNTLLESILALVESRESTPKSNRMSRLAKICNESITIKSLNSLSVDSVMVAVHLFVAYQSLGERLTAWYYLQQAMTLLLMLGPLDWNSVARNEEYLRLYFILSISERALLVLQQLPPSVDRPIRLQDNAYDSSAQVRSTLPPSALSDFPLSHLRLFCLIRTPHVGCWRGACEGAKGCLAWTVEMARDTMSCFDEEMTKAMVAWNYRQKDSMQLANLIITISWFRDRFWNIFLRHSLTGIHGEDDLGFNAIDSNLLEVTDFCTQIKISEFDKGLDCNAKLLDMATTAILIIKVLNIKRNPGDVTPTSASLRAKLLASVYRILGLLTMLETDQDGFCQRLRQDLASVA